MRHCLHVLCTSLALQTATICAADQIVTLGDSLSFAYEAEFGFEIAIQNTTYPFGFETVGDGFGPEVRNWIEILGDPTYRQQHFDLGTRDSITLQTAFLPPASETLFFRQEYNWSVPGYRIDQLRSFVSGESTVTQILSENPEFATLETALAFSDFDENEDFAVADLITQIQSTAERVVLFIGGNDINGVYGTIYGGGDPGTFVADFMDDATFIIDWIRGHNPTIQIVVAAVPHVGITPDVQSRFPTDAIKTARVTDVLRDLNGQLATLAASRGAGYADLFSTTLSLLDPNPLCVHGLPFANSGSTTGDTDFVWLNGVLSFNFHPNTSAQALIANAMIDAFNETYDTGIAPLTATEILGGLLGKSVSEIDMPFADWMTCHALPGASESDDSDHDHLPAGLEFALGLDPTVNDAGKVTVRRIDNAGAPALEVSYPVRLPASTEVALTPASSATLGSPFNPFATNPAPGPDGLARAVLPLDDTRGFLRLEATITP
jgi:lysophospholipase L1-like esterase